MKLGQLLGQLGVFLTFAAATVRRNREEKDNRARDRRERERQTDTEERRHKSKRSSDDKEERARRAREVWKRENRGRREEKGRACLIMPMSSSAHRQPSCSSPACHRPSHARRSSSSYASVDRTGGGGGGGERGKDEHQIIPEEVAEGKVLPGRKEPLCPGAKGASLSWMPATCPRVEGASKFPTTDVMSFMFLHAERASGDLFSCTVLVDACAGPAGMAAPFVALRPTLDMTLDLESERPPRSCSTSSKYDSVHPGRQIGGTC